MAEVLILYWPALVCVAAAAGLTIAEMRGWHAGQWAFKPLASLMFVTQAVLLGAFGSLYGSLVLAALVLCLIGDVVLIIRDREALFKAGIGVFLLGHIVYIAAFASAGLSLMPMVPGALIMAGVTFIYWRYISARLAPDFKAQVGAYTAVINVMVITAFGASTPGGWTVPLAAVMFALSDMMVGRDRFVASAPVNFLIITPLYFGAQLLFAASV
ncbi:lysoplasmalogenase [Aquisalinus flavus]|uniref:Lysoplasmalogenase n=1 Tax=Aquisalinus flavus TaxID=1526572 RepID=A0A8J2Y7X0_9PROT|nr:lysoplasmalogenase [Aquisalinus flavus]MBD0426394.1 lysoplasmalogenase [Aquisalinus flavus]UNE48046.1 lysoplasmalogenase [Aquisalinus flavus]GGD08296.1 hypothetical protein GCM10011342_16420 [Aquisalinus flavus]